MPDDRRVALAEWFPVYLQYLGSLLACVLIGATLFGRADLDWAPAWIAVAGMIGLRPVWNFGREPLEPTAPPPPTPPADKLDFEDRWSHLDGPRA